MLIVARYASTRAGLVAMLEENGIEIVDEIAGSADLEAAFPRDSADAVLYDVEPSDAHEVIRVAGVHDAALVALDSGPDLAQALGVAPLRGWALLPKEADREEIVAALYAASSGLISFDRSAALTLLRPPLLAAGASLAETDILTPREREILQQMAEGLPNKQIALRLSISLHTVKFHVASILAKLGVQSRTEAVTLGVRQGLVLL